MLHGQRFVVICALLSAEQTAHRSLAQSPAQLQLIVGERMRVTETQGLWQLNVEVRNTGAVRSTRTQITARACLAATHRGRAKRNAPVAPFLLRTG